MLANDSQVMSKTKELCEAIAENPEYKSLLEKVERFLEDDAAKLQFQSVQERSHELGQKQQSGLELSSGEVEDFEAAREALMENSVARDFMDAQQSLQSVQAAIGKYVGMTLGLVVCQRRRTWLIRGDAAVRVAEDAVSGRPGWTVPTMLLVEGPVYQSNWAPASWSRK